ncbi:MAG TPA: 5'-nucleotidase [Draconibacterium sp.]|nr:5'-nucleotidase [Draconibacterium sp.]
MVRSFSYTLLITWILLSVSCKTNFTATKTDAQNISVSENTLPVDSQLVEQYLPKKKILEKDMSRVISMSDIELVKQKPESGLTNLLADLLLNEGKKFSRESNLQINPEISYFNYGGIRTSLPKGEITVGKIFELMPFENEMVFIQLTGAQLQQFYNQVADFGGESVGGVRFVISNGKAKDIFINGELLNTEKKYWLVTNDYSANGGDDLEVFTHRLEFIGSNKKIRDIIISNFEERQKNGEVISEILDGRIKNE